MTEDFRPNAVLRSGPPIGFPDELRVRYVVDLSEPVKILRGNRWEHFHPTGSLHRGDGHDLWVFAWSRSTFVAE